MEDKITLAKNLIKSCSVPELTKDLDETPLDTDNFEEYRKLLNIQLPMLFDFVQQNEELLLSKEYNESVWDVKGMLLILTAEVTASKSVYRIQNEQFLNVFDEIIKKYFNVIFDSKVDDFILRHYTDNLQSHNWKRNIGAVYGFNRFLELIVFGGRELPTKWTNLTLSVSLNVRQCLFEAFTDLSTNMFQKILSHADPKQIKEMNIYAVIYESVINTLHLLKTVEGHSAAWKCILHSLDFKEEGDSYKWDLSDEMLESLLRSIRLTTDAEIAICLFSFIPKVIIRFSANRKEIYEFLDRDYDSMTEEDFKKFRLEASKINSMAAYRWALYIVRLYSSDPARYLGSPSVCERMLQQFHVSYISCFYIISVEIMNYNLLKFFEFFGKLLADALAAHTETPRIKELVKQIYVTFIDHLEKSDLQGVTKDFQPYHKAFKKFVEEP